MVNLFFGGMDHFTFPPSSSSSFMLLVLVLVLHFVLHLLALTPLSFHNLLVCVS